VGTLHLHWGRAGTGKSSYVCQTIAAELAKNPTGAPIYWVVPDDASYAAERMLMASVPSALRAEVITLRRLAERARRVDLMHHGKSVNATGKRLLLASVYEVAYPVLGPLRRDTPSIGFYDAILHAMDEMTAYRVDLHQLETTLQIAATSLPQDAASGQYITGRTLLAKLQDLCVLYVYYQRALQQQNLVDPANFLDLVQPHLAEWPLIHGTTLYVDGFIDMTPQEQAFLLSLAEVAEKTEVLLSVDARWFRDVHVAPDATGEFPKAALDAAGSPILEMLDAMPRQGAVYAPQTLHLATSLKAQASTRGLHVETSAFTQPARFAVPALAYLESSLYGERVDAIRAPSAQGIEIYEAQHPRAEVDGVARQILQHVTIGHGRYRDVAVLVPSLADYAEHLRDAFTRYQIPYSMDDFPSLETYPLSKFILAAMAIVETNWGREAVQRLLKTDFTGVSQEDADWLEAYLKRHEVEGARHWLQATPWRFTLDTQDPASATRADAEDMRAERIRCDLTRYLAPFYTEFERDRMTPQAFAQVLWKLLSAVDAKRQVAHWMLNEDASESPLEASLHEQAWQKWMALFNDLSQVATTATLSQRELFAIVRADLDAQSLITIPTGVQEVIVADLSRASTISANTVYVVGLNDHAVPHRWHASGLLQDDERLLFRQLFGHVVGYTAQEQQICERARVYGAFTRASHRLVLSCSLSSTEGKALRPSPLISRVRALFPEASWTTAVWKDRMDAADESRLGDAVLTPDAALDILIGGLHAAKVGRDIPALGAIARWFLTDEAKRSRIGRALRGFSHRTVAKALDVSVTRALYGTPARMNVYQLEAYAACPYKQFAQNGLRIAAEVGADVSPAVRGTLLHDVLQAFVEVGMADEAKWQAMTDDQAVEQMRVCFESVLNRPQSATWLREKIRTEQALAAQSVLHRAAVVLTRHARYGAFAPRALELSFGTGTDEHLPGFDVQLGDGLQVSLRGRIDRVDVAEVDGQPTFRIIDYKSSQMELDLTKIAHGLRLQLPVYASVVAAHSSLLFGRPHKPVALMYVPIARKVELKNAPDAVSDAFVEALKRMRARGWMIADKAVVTRMDARLVDGDSELFAKVFNKDGRLSAYAPALDIDDWDWMLETALKNVRTFARRMLHGDIEIAPYRIGQKERACDMCDYQSLCHIDPRTDGRLYRKLPTIPKQNRQSDAPSKGDA